MTELDTSKIVAFGQVRWVHTTPNEATGLKTPIASMAGGQAFRLQQLLDRGGKPRWVDVTGED